MPLTESLHAQERDTQVMHYLLSAGGGWKGYGIEVTAFVSTSGGLHSSQTLQIYISLNTGDLYSNGL